MATNIVSALGAGSGIDIKGLADSLVEAERAPKKERIDKKITQAEAKISGYGALKFALSDLKNAFNKINDASDFSSIKPSNTQPSAFGVTASSTAEAGSFSLEVTQIALAQRTASQSFPERGTPINGGSAFSLNLTVGGVNKGDIRVTTDTPAGMVGAINGAKLGVTAQLVNTGSGYNVVLNGATGAAQSFSMASAQTVSTTASVTENTDSSLVVSAGSGASAVSVSYPDPEDATSTLSLTLAKDVDGLWRPDASATLPAAGTVFTVSAFKPAVVFNQALQTATDAQFKVNGMPVSRSTNSINDVIDGVTLDLYAATTGAARLDLNRDTAGIKDNIQGLVTAYNDLEAGLKILGDSASDVENFGGVLAGESLLQSVRGQVRALITNTSNTPGTTIKAARDVGLTFDRFGKLNLDSAKLDAALQNNFGEVSTMFTAGTNNKSIYSTAPSGLAGSAINSLEKMLLSTGLIETTSKSAAAAIARHKKELTILSERMERLMTRYMSQFSAMESIVGNSNSTRSGLKSTFDGMMSSYSN